MLVTHYLGILSINKDVKDNVGFLLANKKGGYCSFFDKPFSKYQGLFYFDEKAMKMYKFIENIEIAGQENVDSLKNGFYFIERKKGDISETFLVPKRLNSLIYELNCPCEIDLILDCKDSYDSREFGRYYEASEEDGLLIIKFTKKTDKKEDSSDGQEEFILYLAVKSDNSFYELNGKWTERHYPLDEERNSPPFRRHVYNALRLKGAKFVFSMSGNKNSAKRSSYRVSSRSEMSPRASCFNRASSAPRSIPFTGSTK